MPSTAVYPLSAKPTSPASARAHVRAAMSGHRHDEARAEAAIIVSELVTNAVSHGSEPIRLRLRLGTEDLCIEVTDAASDTSAVVARVAAPDAPSGRGLAIVELLAKSWGVVPRRHGKTVWAVLSLHEDQAPADPLPRGLAARLRAATAVAGRGD